MNENKVHFLRRKDKIDEAIRLALSRFEGLTRSVDDGCGEIDSNTFERSIKSIALYRKMPLCWLRWRR